MISDAHAESEKPEQNLYCKGDLQQDIQQPTAISTIRLMRSPAHTIEWTVDYITGDPQKKPAFILVELFDLKLDGLQPDQVYVFEDEEAIPVGVALQYVPLTWHLIASTRLMPPTNFGIRLAVRLPLIEPQYSFPSRLVLRVFEQGAGQLQVIESRLFNFKGPKEDIRKFQHVIWTN